MLNNITTVKKKNNLKKGCNFLFLIGFIAILSGCKSSKNVITSEGVAVNKANEQLVEDILSAETSYKTISGKVSLELIGNNKTSGMKVNSQLKIIRDDIIQLSIRAPFINTEVFRLDITSDSISVIDRLGKRYAIQSIKDMGAQKGIQFNYANLQALFTNQLFIPGSQNISKNDYRNFNINLNNGLYNLVAKDKSGIVYDFTVDSSDRIVATKMSHENKTYSLNWLYSDFVKESENIYPTKMNVQVDADKIKFACIMSYSTLDINKELKVDRNMPSNYQKVSVLEIIKSYLK